VDDADWPRMAPLCIIDVTSFVRHTSRHALGLCQPQPVSQSPDAFSLASGVFTAIELNDGLDRVNIRQLKTFTAFVSGLMCLDVLRLIRVRVGPSQQCYFSNDFIVTV